MTAVINTFNDIERKTWHSLETFSQNHPRSSKYLLPLPVAIEHIVKSTLTHPCQAVEHLVEIGINGVRYFREPDPKKAFWINNTIQSHIFNFIKSVFSALIFPLFRLFNRSILL